jgi:hypothetical protein
MRDSTRPIRALNRGLDVLTELNRLERAAINTIAQAVDCRARRLIESSKHCASRATWSAIRMTIAIARPSWCARCRTASTMRRCSPIIARPHLSALCEQIVWPVAIATPSGSAMMIREATDHQSPLALEHYGAGVRVPMLASAAGRAYLAFCASTTARSDARTALAFLAAGGSPRAQSPRSRAPAQRDADSRLRDLPACAPRFRGDEPRDPDYAPRIGFSRRSRSAIRRPRCRCGPRSTSSCRKCATSPRRSNARSA